MNEKMTNNNFKKQYQYNDIPTILLESRVINLVGPVDEYLSNRVVSSLLVLDEQSHKPIQIFINSPGGHVHDGLAIIDTMNFIQSPVYVYVTFAASMGAAIASAGEKGHRYALPNATIMLHQVSSGTQGNIQDQRVRLKYSENLNDRLATIISENCGIDKQKYLDDTLRDHWMFADDAVEYGILDKVVKSTDEL